MVLIGAFVACVAGWAVFGLLSNGDRKRAPFPFSRAPEPNYLKTWRERPSTRRETLFGLLSFACLVAVIGLLWYSQTEMCKADPSKCRGGKVEQTMPEDAGLPEGKPAD